jgi:hypothetical protein
MQRGASNSQGPAMHDKDGELQIATSLDQNTWKFLNAQIQF